MFFPAPSPKNSNHAGLYLNEAGQLVDRHGGLWSASSMAFDELPDLSDLNKRADETEKAEKRLKDFVNDCEELLEECDPRWAIKFREMLDKHRLSSRMQYEDKGPDARLDDGRGAGATDEESPVDTDRLAKFLSDNGLSQSEVAEALSIATGGSTGHEEDDMREALSRSLKKAGVAKDARRGIVDHLMQQAKDRLPANGLPSSGGMGGHLSGVGKHDLAHDRFIEMFPGATAARLQSMDRDFSSGTANKRAEQRQQRRGTARDTQDASESFYELFPGARRLQQRGL